MAGDRYERGLEIRRRVAGAEYVDRSLAAADEFNGPLQDLVTEYCWGEVWGRDGLDGASATHPRPSMQVGD